MPAPDVGIGRALPAGDRAIALRPYLMVEKVFHSRYHLAENRGGFQQPPGD